MAVAKHFAFNEQDGPWLLESTPPSPNPWESTNSKVLGRYGWTFFSGWAWWMLMGFPWFPYHLGSSPKGCVFSPLAPGNQSDDYGCESF